MSNFPKRGPRDDSEPELRSESLSIRYCLLSNILVIKSTPSAYSVQLSNVVHREDIESTSVGRGIARGREPLRTPSRVVRIMSEIRLIESETTSAPEDSPLIH